jgi:2-polyprenyl-3-methyl-5-hydroxy-6-metoxy-1,4-benzoquinol methylase
MATSRIRAGSAKLIKAQRDHYGSAYGRFASKLYAEIRAEAFGEDIGQQSWLSSAEQDQLIPWLALGPGSRLLDIACGSGGPTLRIAERTGCMVQGIDFESKAIAAAEELTRKRGLTHRAKFIVADATRKSKFKGSSFDAIICIDAISHFPDRHAVLLEWTRLLKPGANVLFTDPLVITGPISTQEIDIRSLHGAQLFVPFGFNENVIAAAGLSLVRTEDATGNLARFAASRLAAREARREALLKVEGKLRIERSSELFRVAAKLASERRLSRFLYHARRPA